jgi:hypothetical protein
LSFNFEDGVVAAEPGEVLLGLAGKSDAEVGKLLKGHDLGIVQTVFETNSLPKSRLLPPLMREKPAIPNAG